jgi:hypothetical protein
MTLETRENIESGLMVETCTVIISIERIDSIGVGSHVITPPAQNIEIIIIFRNRVTIKVGEWL